MDDFMKFSMSTSGGSSSGGCGEGFWLVIMILLLIYAIYKFATI